MGDLKVFIDGAELKVAKAGKAIRDLLSPSHQAVIDAGTFELCTKGEEGDVVDIDDPLDALGEDGDLHLVHRRVSLPTFWAGQEYFRSLREYLFVTLPAVDAEFARLHLRIVSTLSDAGFRAVGFDSLSGFQDALGRLKTSHRTAAGRGILIICDSIMQGEISELIVTWRQDAQLRALFSDMLQKREPIKCDPDESFRRLMPSTSWPGAPDLNGTVSQLCEDITASLATDVGSQILVKASALVPADEPHDTAQGPKDLQELIDSAEVIASRVPSLPPSQWHRLSIALTSLLMSWLRHDPRLGLNGIHAKKIRDDFYRPGLHDLRLSELIRWDSKVSDALDRCPLALKKGIEWAEFRQAYAS